MKSYCINTKPRSGGILVFCTKANNGKEALKNLIEKSGDFNQILGKKESDNMVIEIEKI